ncbi:hypothetical protein OH768_20005 [Streptomyces sp. NBC_01622]|uniref:hypothetical protein n=1 Tax=Streptomyces sp. NBC_01622 TaxID=2975903 RepID=UPI00386E06C6|nr:hypothetical protein OH768_20005 [Streptomyces sp. NBC_01622]
MADERSAVPGGTPRTPGRWLDRETAELLLRGESLEAVDPAARDQAERLARTLGALAVEPTSGKAELPGEEAALAAFRAARTGNDVERAALGGPGRAHSSDAGLVRLGRPVETVRGPRLGRPARFGLTAALAVGLAGGVAAAVGTGVLPSPFDDPTPAASVSAAATPDRPLVSPSPRGTFGSGTPSAGGGTDGSDDSSGEAVGGGTDRTPAAGTGEDNSAHSGSWWSAVASSCRAVRDGKFLEPGRKRTLEGVAGGTSHVWTYCKGLLKNTGGGSDDQGSGSGSGDGKNGGSQGGDQSGGLGGDDEGTGNIAPIAPGGGNGSGGSAGGHKGNGVVATPLPSAFTPPARQTPSTPAASYTTGASRTPAPGPTYSAL